ncbi:MAG: acetyltransferase [Frankiales bacterium]|nr:acetyltransferase [Frankiales bacterium]
MADPEVVHDEASSRFVAQVDGAEAGYAEYAREGGSLRFTHTVVDPAFEGRGVGSLLVRTALAAAREQGDAVLPQCSFVRSYLASHPDLVDLVPADERPRYGL